MTAEPLPFAAPAPRTYGTLKYLPPAGGRRSGSWRIDAEPHVIVRLKRLFPRVLSTRGGAVIVADTPEIARDIVWATERWPLVCEPADARRLASQDQTHRATEATVLNILDGRRVPPGEGWLVPAREPYDYQLVAADIALSTGRLLLTDGLAMGKSMSGALVLRNPQALPALVVTLTHLPPQWKKEIAKTFPGLVVHIVTKGTPYDPAEVRGPDKGKTPDVLVISYSKLAGWADHLAGKIRTVLFDEIQELRRDGTARYTAAARVADGATYLCGLSASPIYNYGEEIHNVVQVLAPDALGTLYEFRREWCTMMGNGKHKVVDPAALGAYLRDQGLMLGRDWSDVGKTWEQPVLVEQTVDTDPAAIDALTGDVAEMARLVLSSSSTNFEKMKAAGELDWRLRQATGIAKAPYAASFVDLLLDSEPAVVVWAWHRTVHEILMDRLKAHNPVLYTGTESPAQKAEAERAFLSGESRVLIMSLRSGAGLDGLQEVCSTGVFAEVDWSPEVHRQCIGRLDRPGKTRPVVGYFLLSEDGSDPVIGETLQIKKMQSAPMLRPSGGLFVPAPAAYNKVRLLAEAALARAEGRRASPSRRATGPGGTAVSAGRPDDRDRPGPAA